MSDQEYLQSVLGDQTLTDDSDELKTLRTRRADVESLLRSAFPGKKFSFRYGGSMAKGTLIREQYDLDLIFYVHADEVGCGDTLEDIYNNVAAALGSGYQVRRKTSALRLLGSGVASKGQDFHIDVVPGRFTDGSQKDCYLHQTTGEKSRLKTNLDVHIEHVRGCGVIDAVRLLKLIRVRRAIPVKQFIWELMNIDALNAFKRRGLPEQVEIALRAIADAEVPPNVEDPANPKGNDLSGAVSDAWLEMKAATKSVIRQVDAKGWTAVLGPVSERNEAIRSAVVKTAVAATSAPAKAWWRD